jgi:hypothetical protein
VVKQMSLAFAVAATLGLAASPRTGLLLSSAQFETFSTLITGAVLLAVAISARKVAIRKD